MINNASLSVTLAFVNDAKIRKLESGEIEKIVETFNKKFKFPLNKVHPHISTGEYDEIDTLLFSASYLSNKPFLRYETEPFQVIIEVPEKKESIVKLKQVEVRSNTVEWKQIKVRSKINITFYRFGAICITYTIELKDIEIFSLIGIVNTLPISLVYNRFAMGITEDPYEIDVVGKYVNKEYLKIENDGYMSMGEFLAKLRGMLEGNVDSPKENVFSIFINVSDSKISDNDIENIKESIYSISGLKIVFPDENISPIKSSSLHTNGQITLCIDHKKNIVIDDFLMPQTSALYANPIFIRMVEHIEAVSSMLNHFDKLIVEEVKKEDNSFERIGVVESLRKQIFSSVEEYHNIGQTRFTLISTLFEKFKDIYGLKKSYDHISLRISNLAETTNEIYNAKQTQEANEMQHASHNQEDIMEKLELIFFIYYFTLIFHYGIYYYTKESDVYKTLYYSFTMGIPFYLSLVLFSVVFGLYIVYILGKRIHDNRHIFTILALISGAGVFLEMMFVTDKTIFYLIAIFSLTASLLFIIKTFLLSKNTRNRG